MLKKIFLISMCMFFGLPAIVDSEGRIFYDEIIIINDTEKDVLVDGQLCKSNHQVTIKTGRTEEIKIDIMQTTSYCIVLNYDSLTNAIKPVNDSHDVMYYQVSKLLDFKEHNNKRIAEAYKNFETEFTRDVFEKTRAETLQQIENEKAKLLGAAILLEEIEKLEKKKAQVLGMTYENILKQTEEKIRALVGEINLPVQDRENDLDE